MSFSVIGGPASLSIAKKIAKRLDVKYTQAKVKMFPDGERKITISEKPSGTIIIVNSTHPPTDSNLVQTFFLIHKSRQYASKVIAVIPYLGYMRQDIEFLPGEIVTSAVVAKSLFACGASKVVTVDIHSKLALNYFDIPIHNVSAIPKLAQYFKKMNLNHPLVVSPDLFWSNHAKEFASILGADSIALNKQRNRKTGRLKIIQSKKTDLMGRDIILVDDMISTGNSMIKAAQYLQDQNCGRIFACCTHGILVNDAEKRAKQAGIKKIVCTNTIPGKNSLVDVSDILADAI